MLSKYHYLLKDDPDYQDDTLEFNLYLCIGGDLIRKLWMHFNHVNSPKESNAYIRLINQCQKQINIEENKIKIMIQIIYYNILPSGLDRMLYEFIRPAKTQITKMRRHGIFYGGHDYLIFA